MKMVLFLIGYSPKVPLVHTFHADVQKKHHDEVLCIHILDTFSPKEMKIFGKTLFHAGMREILS